MIEFITLLLGALVAEPTQIRLQVHRDVVAVDLRLDGRSLGTLREAPWELEVDFGEELLPHRLEAVAFAGNGKEIGRARQWVNLAPKGSGVAIVLDRDRSTGSVTARLSWESLSQDNEPVTATVLFDGEALAVDDPRVIELPAHDPERLHHLEVELEFPGALRSTAEITFGGHYGDTVSSELTAFAIALEPRRELPAVEEMQGWFLSQNRSAPDLPLPVHSAEKGLAEIVFVLSPSAREFLRPYPRRDGKPPRPLLSKDHRLRFVGVHPVLVTRDEGPFVVFPRSAEVRTRVVGLRRILSTLELPVGPPEEARIADAVAVAGSFAHQSGRRRAVVLIATGDSEDASQFSPVRVRRYLESLGVPFRVWNPELGRKEAGRWGAASNISTNSLLDGAYRELRKALDRQRIVWLSGSYLPQTLVVAPKVEGVRALR